MNFRFLNPPLKRYEFETAEQLLAIVHKPPRNSSDGGEFLDDALRMKDQPFMYTQTEESVAAGSPDDFF